MKGLVPSFVMFNLTWFKNLGEEGNTFELNKSLKSLYEESFKFSVFPKVLPKFELRQNLELLFAIGFSVKLYQ
jgi:hypothetical protein